MRSSCSIIICLSLLISGSALASPPPPIIVNATLVELPRTEPCNRSRNRVVARYRLEQVLEGNLPESNLLNEPLYVVHRCPEHSRGSSRLGKGTAGPLRAGQAHRMKLATLTNTEGLIDRFMDTDRPRFQALETDPSPPPPQMIVKVKGGAGSATRIAFEKLKISIGRAMNSDILLSDKSVALRHLQLEVRGDKVAVVNLTGRADTTINDRPITSPQKITYRDKIVVGLYTLSVSLLMPKKMAPLSPAE